MPAALVPMSLPATTLPVIVPAARPVGKIDPMTTPASVLPEITLRSRASFTAPSWPEVPSKLNDPVPSKSTPSRLGIAAVPAAFVPIRLPATTLAVES